MESALDSLWDNRFMPCDSVFSHGSEDQREDIAALWHMAQKLTSLSVADMGRMTVADLITYIMHA